ncbi:MAG: Crp/Fnr family transcriptional regulator [Bacteroidota bacterium]
MPDAADAFPFLSEATPTFRDAFVQTARPLHLDAGSPICLEGDLCRHLPLVVRGTGRVYRISETGRALTLYRVEPGESCILTASCVLSARPFPAFAEAETDVEAFAVPAEAFRAWFDASPAWRGYVFDLLARRFADVVELVEAVAFQRVDERLAAHLLTEQNAAGHVVRTHEALAADLGTSREVVSRVLKEFERQGLVTLNRGRVLLDDAAGLAHR